jgi:hypothetical protein
MAEDKNRVMPSASSLVSPAKSSRLQAMREQSMQIKTVQTVEVSDKNPLHSNVSPELLLARQVIDTRLTEVLHLLPEGKQKRLFKLRFGVELTEIRNLPIKRIVNLLAITHPQLHKLISSKNSIAELNYNGE